jgi:hypothetical protein
MKNLTLSDGSSIIDVQVDKVLCTKVSEECMSRLKVKDKIDPHQVVKEVLLAHLHINPEEFSNWTLLTE